jgi:branched-subunit amino acid ABC-type transport system permease component
MLTVAIVAMAALGMLIARYLVLPLRSAPALNTLLITLMLGTVLRESVRMTSCRSVRSTGTSPSSSSSTRWA